MTQNDHNQKYLQVGLFVIILIFFGLTAWYFFSMYNNLSADNIKDFIDGFGAWAPVVFVLVYTISSPVPLVGTFFSAGAGLLFGTLPGTLLAIFSSTVSSFIPFYLSRSLGREWVEKRIKNEQLQAAYEQSEGQGGFLFVLMMRLVPIFPFEIQNYIAGLTKVKIPAFIAGTILGIIPGTFTLVFLGDSIKDPTSWQFFAAIGINVVAILVNMVVVLIRRKGKIKKTGGSSSENENRDVMAA